MTNLPSKIDLTKKFLKEKSNGIKEENFIIDNNQITESNIGKAIISVVKIEEEYIQEESLHSVEIQRFENLFYNQKLYNSNQKKEITHKNEENDKKHSFKTIIQKMKTNIANEFETMKNVQNIEGLSKKDLSPFILQKYRLSTNLKKYPLNSTTIKMKKHSIDYSNKSSSSSSTCTSISVDKRNARERTRVHTVNQAFHLLKLQLPALRANIKRVSKLKILRAAVNYICLLDNFFNDSLINDTKNDFKFKEIIVGRNEVYKNITKVIKKKIF